MAITKMRASHILLSYRGAENSTHGRGIGEAMAEGERIIKQLHEGGVSFDQLAKENSAQMFGGRRMSMGSGIYPKRRLFFWTARCLRG